MIMIVITPIIIGSVYSEFDSGCREGDWLTAAARTACAKFQRPFASDVATVFTLHATLVNG